MKLIFNILTAFLYLFLLSGCGRSGKTTTTGTATTPTTPTRPSVYLKASNMGNISHINFRVYLPAGTSKNLLDYNGQATIQGTLQSSTWPCVKASASFNCQAQLSHGNINANNCSVGGHPIAMQIVLLRGKQIQESYSISSIIAQPGMSCFLPKT